MRTIKIQNQRIGDRYPTFVIAEVGINHNGKFQLAKKLVIEAAKTGADAVKFQMFKADKLVTRHNTFVYNFFKQHEFKISQWKELAHLAKKIGILFSASVFDEQSADFLSEIGAPFFKIASGDLTHIPLLKYVARKKEPMFVSTGAGDLKNIRDALNAIFSTGNRQLVLLHCISNYPTQPQDAHLEMIPFLKKKFHLPVGFSDHTIGIGIPIGAVALGANVIEKHFTLDTNMPGPDHKLSLNPRDMTLMIEAIRKVEVAVGSSPARFLRHRPDERERFGARRTIVSGVFIPKGAKISPQMLKIVRAGNRGLMPKYLDRVIGKVAKKDIEKEQPITRDLFEG